VVTEGQSQTTMTHTAQVPRVAGPGWAGMDPRFSPTGVVPAVPRSAGRRPAPGALRVLVWATALLVAVGAAGLVVHAVRPQWLSRLAISSGAPSSVSTALGTGSASAPAAPAAGRGTVSRSSTGPTSANFSVRASAFTVVISTRNPCWVEVTAAGTTPEFASVVPAGARKTFTSDHGRLAVQLGAGGVTVQLQVGNKLVRGWQFTPTAAPFTMDFTAAAP